MSRDPQSRYLSRSVVVACWLLLSVVWAWAASALWIQLSDRPGQRSLVVVAWCLSVWLLVQGLRRGGPAGNRVAATYLLALQLLALAIWWGGLRPSHDRQWADDVAQMLSAQTDGDVVTLHHVRNFNWRTDDDYDAKWETRRYDLDDLVSADLFLSYWMGPAIAHTLVSFRFRDGQRVVFSLEIRKKRGEQFSAVGGFFRQFEQILVAADEQDILRVRSDVRGETLYRYPLSLTPSQLRIVFLDYLARAESLRRQPSFYNTVTSNCTTILYAVARSIAPGLPLDVRLLLSGYFAEYAYEHGGLASEAPFAVLQDQGLVPDASARDPSLSYSQAIRVPAGEQGASRSLP